MGFGGGKCIAVTISKACPSPRGTARTPPTQGWGRFFSSAGAKTVTVGRRTRPADQAVSGLDPFGATLAHPKRTPTARDTVKFPDGGSNNTGALLAVYFHFPEVTHTYPLPELLRSTPASPDAGKPRPPDLPESSRPKQRRRRLPARLRIPGGRSSARSKRQRPVAPLHTGP